LLTILEAGKSIIKVTAFGEGFLLCHSMAKDERASDREKVNSLFLKVLASIYFSIDEG
jgi:hypothetical protein